MKMCCVSTGNRTLIRDLTGHRSRPLNYQHDKFFTTKSAPIRTCAEISGLQGPRVSIYTLGA